MSYKVEIHNFQYNTHDQTEFITDRYIFSNIVALQNLIDYVIKIHIASLVSCVNFEKAYDSIKWSFLFEVLKDFNLGENFIRWVKMFYSDSSTIIQNAAYFK